MTMEVELAPMIDNKADAGSDWFFCDGCLAYHPPEYRAEYHSDYRKYCYFALAVIRDEELPVDDTPLSSISYAQDIDDTAVKLSNPIETTCPDTSMPVNLTRKNRALRKDLPEDEIIDSTEPYRVLAEKYGVSRTTILNIKKGQRVLV